MRPQSCVERIFFENFPCLPRGFFLSRRQTIETHPKAFNRAVAIFHCRRGGGVSCKAVSISTKRPASASFMASLNSSGIHESSFSTMNLATCARWSAGNSLICSMTSAALVKKLSPQFYSRQEAFLSCRGANKPRSSWVTTAKSPSARNAIRLRHLHVPKSSAACGQMATSITSVRHQTKNQNPSSCFIVRSFNPVSFCPHTKVSF